MKYLDPNIIEVEISYREIAETPLWQACGINNVILYGLSIGYFTRVETWDDDNKGIRRIRFFLSETVPPEFIKLSLPSGIG